jgi:hypothetical protein
MCLEIFAASINIDARRTLRCQVLAASACSGAVALRLQSHPMEPSCCVCSHVRWSRRAAFAVTSDDALSLLALEQQLGGEGARFLQLKSGMEMWSLCLGGP